MKNIFLITLAALVMACQQSDKGAKNAIQFVREEMSSLADDIKDIRVIGQDSVVFLLWETAAVIDSTARFAESSYYQLEARTKVDTEGFGTFLRRHGSTFDEAYQHWLTIPYTSDTVNDKHSWRKIYLVEIEMKSGKVREERVIMDRDSITPRYTSQGYVQELKEYNDAISRAYKNIQEVYHTMTDLGIGFRNPRN